MARKSYAAAAASAASVSEREATPPLAREGEVVQLEETGDASQTSAASGSFIRSGPSPPGAPAGDVHPADSPAASAVLSGEERETREVPLAEGLKTSGSVSPSEKLACLSRADSGASSSTPRQHLHQSNHSHHIHHQHNAISSPLPFLEPGKVKLLKEQFERQASDASAAAAEMQQLQHQRLLQRTHQHHHHHHHHHHQQQQRDRSHSRLSSAEEGRESLSPHVRENPMLLVEDAKACAEYIRGLQEQKEELQKQVDLLWSQREAFRNANLRMSRMLQEQQTQGDASDSQRRKVLTGSSRRSAGGGVLSGFVEGEAGQPLLLGTRRSSCLVGTSLASESASPPTSEKPLATDIRPEEAVSCSLPPPIRTAVLPPLSLACLDKPPSVCRFSEQFAATARRSLAATALKTPRRSFVEGCISARTSTDRAGDRRVELSQHPAQLRRLEEALLSSFKNMRLLRQTDGEIADSGGATAGGGGTSSSIQRGDDGRLGRRRSAGDFDEALRLCSSTPSNGYWHSVYLCVLKVHNSDFFLDVKSTHNGRDMKGGLLFASKETAGVFRVCVRHLFPDDSWFRAVVTGWFWRIPVAVEAGRTPRDYPLPPSDEQEERDSSLSSCAASSQSKKPARVKAPQSSGSSSRLDAGTSDGGDRVFSEWDAVSLMYLRSMDATGETVADKVVGSGQSLYVTWRPPQHSAASTKYALKSRTLLDASTVTAWFEAELASPRTPALLATGTEEAFSAAVQRCKTEPFSETWRLVLAEGQQEEQLFLTKAVDREAGLLPFYHLSTQRYLHVHPTYGVVGLVLPEMQQRRMLQNHLQRQEKEESSNKARAKSGQKPTKCRRRTRVQRLKAAEGSSQSNSNSSVGNANGKTNVDRSFTAAQPSFIEMIPLADMLLQQSVQNVLESIVDSDAPDGEVPLGVRCSARVTTRQCPEKPFHQRMDATCTSLVSSGEAVSEIHTPVETARSLPFSVSTVIEGAASGSEGGQLEFRLDDSSVQTDEEEGSRCGRESLSYQQPDWFEEDHSEFRSARCSPDASPVEGLGLKN